jgi:hypothetical protein
MPTLTKTCLYLLCTALLLLNACKPDKPEEKVYLGYFPATVPLQYLYFKPGSYWIYECDSTGELDSQIMVKCDTPWLRKTYIDYQFILYNKKSITYNSYFNTYYASMDIAYDKKDKDKYYFFNSISSKMPSNSALDCVFFYPFDSSFYGGIGSSPTYYKGHYDSMQVLDRWYKDVRVFQYGTTGFIRPTTKIELLRDGTVTVYWARNVGIIKYNIYTGLWDGKQTPFRYNWNLKRYQVKQ